MRPSLESTSKPRYTTLFCLHVLLVQTQDVVLGENGRMKLSVLMVTYNHERFIAQAITSVLSQCVDFDYEIVVGEDSSTDGTRDILMDFYRRFPDRIVPLLRDRNFGGGRNLEAALAACRGKYVALLEGDDYWISNNKLQRQVEFLETHPDFAVCCHRARILHEVHIGYADVSPSLAAGSYTIEDLLKGNFVMTSTTVVRRNLFGPLPGCFSETGLGDWPRLALAARQGKIELMDEVMAAYRVHAGGIWSSLPVTRRLRDTVRMLRALDQHLGFQHTRTIRRTIARTYFELACHARQDGNRKETGKHLVSCIRDGGLRLGISPRTFAGLAAYTLIGSGYKVFSKANESTNGVAPEASSQANGPSRAGPH
jgi:glycosyltransferase involved in cell wall biosynthesis